MLDAYEVVCRRCGANVKAPCHSKGGKRVAPHQIRRKDARRKADSLVYGKGWDR